MIATNDALPTPEEFERQLAHFITVTLLGGSAQVTRDTRLFEDGHMNSLRILDLIAVVEKTLGCRIPDRAVRLANFGSIAAIVRAFHPHATAAPHADATPERAGRLFERRTDRARFASPVEALEARGDVRLAGAGQVALGGMALDVCRAVDRTVLRWARELGAIERRYPSLIPLEVLERAGQVESFPHQLTLAAPYVAAPPPRDTRAPRHALAPAVCYHAYPEWEQRTLDSAPVVLAARGRCYRSEGGDYAPLERLWDFTMREIIVLGSREQVESMRRSLVRQVAELATTLELDAAIESATDPFFASGDAGRRLMQQAGGLKHELLLTVNADGRAIAAASFNQHHDFFGTRFGIRLAGGGAANSGCVAFGLERWVLALLAQHGVNERAWPAAAREWLAESRAADAGGRPPSSGGVDA